MTKCRASLLNLQHIIGFYTLLQESKCFHLKICQYHYFKGILRVSRSFASNIMMAKNPHQLPNCAKITDLSNFNKILPLMHHTIHDRQIKQIIKRYLFDEKSTNPSTLFHNPTKDLLQELHNLKL